MRPNISFFFLPDEFESKLNTFKWEKEKISYVCVFVCMKVLCCQTDLERFRLKRKMTYVSALHRVNSIYTLYFTLIFKSFASAAPKQHKVIEQMKWYAYFDVN